MSICNMSIEAGARAGMIAPDDTTFAYVASGHRPYAPRGDQLEKALAYWKTLPSDPDARFDRTVTIDAASAGTPGHLGHQPGMVIDIDQPVPAIAQAGVFPGRCRESPGVHWPSNRAPA
jgi:3-isopropylmalate/(R)-2-methylmalate dehydratase large subunit